MARFRDWITYPPIAVGLILLILALMMSFAASYNVSREKTWNYILGEGEHLLDGDGLEGVTVLGRVLEVNAENATIVVITEDMNYTISNNRTVLSLDSDPTLRVENGKVICSYTVRWLEYPYSYISFPAFILAIVGSYFAFRGYISFLESLRENTKKKQEEKNEEA